MKYIGIILLFLVACLFGLGAIYLSLDSYVESSTQLEIDCLTEYADEYCDSQDAILNSISKSNESFSCTLSTDRRTRTKEITKNFYFLDRELQHCTLIKLNGGK